MGNLKGYPGIIIVGHNVNNLRYAAENILIEEYKEDSKIIRHGEEESRKKGLELKREKKTEVIVVSQTNDSRQSKIFINGNNLKQNMISSNIPKL